MRSGPRALWLIRHGESEGNLAREAAYRDGEYRIELPTRDADVPLSPRGEEQARAFGRWLARQPVEGRPTAVLSSPYRRALDTARLALDAAGDALPDLEIDVDERLRDREMGVLEELTWHGVTADHPSEAERADRVGRFAYRPPGGESWADICLRLRSFYADVARELADDRVLVVAHDAVIQLTRVVVEGLSEDEILALSDAVYDNGALTAYERDLKGYRLVAYNETVE
jgi:broad specificity phosphatase PhoE